MLKSLKRKKGTPTIKASKRSNLLGSIIDLTNEDNYLKSKTSYYETKAKKNKLEITNSKEKKIMEEERFEKFFVGIQLFLLHFFARKYYY